MWGGTAQQFRQQLAVARPLSEEMGVATETLATLRGVIANVTPDTDLSSTDKIVQIIGACRLGGEILGAAVTRRTMPRNCSAPPPHPTTAQFSTRNPGTS